MGISPDVGTVAGQGGADSGASRKDRLDGLKARRQVLASQAPEATLDMRGPVTQSVFGQVPAPVQAPAAAASPGFTVAKAQTALQNAPPQIQTAMKQFGAKILQILTRTPADALGLLAQTQFTMTGIEKFAGLLTQKAKEPSAPGGKLAVAALKYLEETDHAKLSVQGLSIEKLQNLSKRIEQIKVRPANAGGVAAPSAATSPRGPAKLHAPPLAAGGRADAVRKQRRMVERAVKLMTETPADAFGMVQGTNFTQAGLARLVEMLKQKANAPMSQGAKSAKEALRQLAPDPGEAEVVHGVSVKKLRTLAARR